MAKRRETLDPSSGGRRWRSVFGGRPGAAALPAVAGSSARESRGRVGLGATSRARLLVAASASVILARSPHLHKGLSALNWWPNWKCHRTVCVPALAILPKMGAGDCRLARFCPVRFGANWHSGTGGGEMHSLSGTRSVTFSVPFMPQRGSTILGLEKCPRQSRCSSSSPLTLVPVLPANCLCRE